LNKYLGWMLLCFFTLAGCGVNKTPEEVFKIGHKSAVRILTPEGNPRGSGFIVNTPTQDKVIITNEHVCDGLNYYRLQFKDLGDIEVYSEPYKSNPDTDLCAFKIPRNFQSVLRGITLADKLSYHTIIYSVGYPVDHPLTLSGGFSLEDGDADIAGVYKPGCKKEMMTLFGPICINSMHLVFTNVVIYPGNSGSMALNESGELIGVFNSASNYTHYGNMIPLKDIKEFINSL
jgi:S1-C subfamily serine protease